MTTGPLAVSMYPWLNELSPWTEALRSRLSLAIDDVAPLRSDLRKNLWIHVKAPPETDHVPVLWVEALKLLRVLANVDRRACWEHVVDLCGVRAKLQALGCPLEFLTSIRPRFELQFVPDAIPSSNLVSLLLDDGLLVDQSSEFSLVAARLLARSSDLGQPTPAALPIALRFNFSIGATTARRCMAQALTLARHLATLDKTETRRFHVQSFGFDLRGASDLVLTKEWLREVACHVPLHDATLYYFRYSSIEHYYGPFLWRLLAPHDNVRAHLGLRSLAIDTARDFTGFHNPEIAAMLSGIGFSRTLDALSFTSKTPYNFWLSWLAFALFSPAAQHQIRTLRLLFGPITKAFVDATRRHAAPTGNHNAADQAAPCIQWPPTVARVNARAKIFGFELPDGNYTKNVYHGTRPVECLVGSQDHGNSVRILIPGVGFGHVARDDVLSLEPATLRPTHSIRNLTLTIEIEHVSYSEQLYGRRALPFDGASVVELLRLIGAPLIQLTIACTGGQPAEPLRVDDVLVSCPQLKSLKLVNLLLAVAPLFTSKHGHTLQSLALVNCTVLNNPRRVGVAAYVAPSVFPRLTSLHVDSTGDELLEYVLALAEQRNLHRLVVKCSDPKMRARFATHMARHDGTSIPVLPLRQKLAFLSVIPTGPTTSSTAKFTVTMDVAALIFDMASTTMRQRVCTLRE